MGLRTGLVGVAAVAVVASGCSGDVVDGRPVGPSAVSGAGFGDPARAATILRNADKAITATNTYSYGNLPAARSNALSWTTGAYRDQYEKAFDTIVSPDAVSELVTQSAVVQKVGLGPVDADGATVLAVGSLAVTRGTTPRETQLEVTIHLRQSGSRWLIDRGTVNGTVTGTPPGTAELGAAVSAVRSGVVALLTIRSSTFDADYDRALAVTAGALHTDLASRRESTRRALTASGADPDAVVRALVVESVSPRQVVTLVAVDPFRLTNGGRSAATPQRFEVTVTARGGHWSLANWTVAGR